MTSFRVGVVGHRPNRLPQEHLGRIHREIEAALRTLQASRDPAACAVVSGLAEGTDRIASEIALKLGWSIEAILPFSKARYVKDFETEESRRHFAELLGRAALVIEAPRADGYPDQNDGYLEQGHAIVSRTEALVTVWDGEGAHGRGGTAEIIDRAKAAGLRVLWIRSNDAVPIKEL